MRANFLGVVPGTEIHTYSTENSVSETTAFGLSGMLDHAFVSEQQSAMTFYSSPFLVAKLSLYSACSSGGKIAFDRWGKYIFL